MYKYNLPAVIKSHNYIKNVMNVEKVLCYSYASKAIS